MTGFIEHVRSLARLSEAAKSARDMRSLAHKRKMWVTVSSTAAKSNIAKKTSSAEGTSGKAASAGKSASGKKVNPALMKPLQPSKELAAVVGSDPLPRPEVVSKVWDYIKRNNLQNPQNKREIKADDKLEKVFGKKSVTMFEMNKHLAQHLK